MLCKLTKAFLTPLECEMSYQGRFVIVWLSWVVGGLCGVVILLVIICYCRLMPRHQKSFDEQYLKENYGIKENYAYTSQDNNYKLKHVEMQRHRPASYAGDAAAAHGPAHHGGGHAPHQPPGPGTHPARRAPPAPAAAPAQYASSSMLDEACASAEALKTRSLPAHVRRARPLSAADTDDKLLHPRLAKVSLSKKCKNRMRSEHAAIIALSKSRSQLLDADLDADAVIVYDQRTQL